MPRPKSHSPESLATAAMAQFWRHGYAATSMADLVNATGVSRQGIYADYGSKRALYLAVFDFYRQNVVDPAFAGVETPGADMRAIEGYFLHQIVRAEGEGLPGPGCLVANAMAETAPHDDLVAEKTHQHNNRLRAGFINALNGEAPAAGKADRVRISALADMLVVFTNGLWTESRTTNHGASLRASATQMLSIIRCELTL